MSNLDFSIETQYFPDISFEFDATSKAAYF